MERPQDMYKLLRERYSSDEMKSLFSEDFKFSTWRELWVALARAEKKVGLKITDCQIADMVLQQHNIDYDIVRLIGRRVKNELKAHVYAYGLQCPGASGIIHLGATETYLQVNTDILNIRSGLKLIRKKMIETIKSCSDFSEKNRNNPISCYGSTIGKLATLWIQEFMENLNDLEFFQNSLKMLGCAYQEIFHPLLEGDEMQVKELNSYIAEEFGFSGVYPILEAYPHNLYVKVMTLLGQIAVSADRMASNICRLKEANEVQELFKPTIESSTVSCQRSDLIGYFAKHAKTLAGEVVSIQEPWIERNWDNSADRRIYISEGFLAIDSVLNLCQSVADDLVVNVNTKVIESVEDEMRSSLIRRDAKQVLEYLRREVYPVLRKSSLAHINSNG